MKKENNPKKIDMDLESFRKKTRKSVWIGFLSLVVALASFTWMLQQEEDSGISWPLRKVLEWNGFLGKQLFEPTRKSVSTQLPKLGSRPRVNGRIGIQERINLNKWKMDVVYQHQGVVEKKLTLSMADFKWLPKTSTVTEFKCIEGWSEVMAFSGVKFSDFLTQYRLGTKDGSTINLGSLSDQLFRYVGFVTPDGEYYVSIDMESMLHPQTILAYEMNGVSLDQKNGAPIRLAIPIKYGIKSLKRIGSIIFSDVKLPDYWAERGYDWYAGL